MRHGAQDNAREIQAFVQEEGPVLDVRSPSEFAHAHLPGAINIPLFDDNERARIGTIYKNSGRREAIRTAFGFVGPKLEDLIRRVDTLAEDTRHVRVYCWRGGMRSEAMSWLLGMAGYRALRLVGGYKAFRRWALGLLESPIKAHVLGGLTGSGKTESLGELAAVGQQVIDLEGMAHHRGSAFGHLGQSPQPTQAQFENRLAAALWRCDLTRPIWFEDESRHVGRCVLPPGIWTQMRAAPTVFIEPDFDERLQRALAAYGTFTTEDLVASVQRIAKQLGSAKTRELVHLIRNGEITEAVRSMLEYYDAKYTFGLSRRDAQQVVRMDVAGMDMRQRAIQAVKAAEDLSKRRNKNRDHHDQAHTQSATG